MDFLLIFLNYISTLKIKELKGKIKVLEDVSSAKSKANSILRKVLAEKEANILIYKGEIALLQKSAHERHHPGAATTFDLRKYEHIITPEIRSELEKCSGDISQDRSFIKKLLQFFFPESFAEKTMLSDLIKYHSSQLNTVKDIFSARVSFFSADSETFAKRNDKIRVHGIISKLLERCKQSRTNQSNELVFEIGEDGALTLA